MKCSQGHEMVFIFRGYACDVCDAERRRAQLMGPRVYDDSDDTGYVTVGKRVSAQQTGGGEWADEQLKAGRAVAFLKCVAGCDGTCDGWQYRVVNGNIQSRHPTKKPKFEDRMARSFPLLNTDKWRTHTFLLIKP